MQEVSFNQEKAELLRELRERGGEVAPCWVAAAEGTFSHFCVFPPVGLLPHLTHW